ncbi:MAG TPA: CRISPR-associated protein Csx19 [Anaerolineae bacterium]|nr:CRISPR-associated protein Csx19 [Anaerolineae bacterium]
MIPQATEVPIGDFASNARGWLATCAIEYGLRYLLAHAEDGVIWGALADDGGLLLSGEAFPELRVALTANTLQQVRLFSDRAEILVWKDGANWKARIIKDDGGKQYDALEDEEYWLWGTPDSNVAPKDGFTFLVEGGHGFRHAPPTAHLNLGKNDRAALKVRHYVDYDDEGQAYIALSRLVKIVNASTGGA